jgi:hypothetical protein
VEGHEFTALRFYLELPTTVSREQIAMAAGVGPAMARHMQPTNFKGPFIHRPGDDDSAAVTFWGKQDLRVVLRKALALLDEHYEKRGR